MNGLRWFHRDVGGGAAPAAWQLEDTLGFWTADSQYIVRDGSDRVSAVAARVVGGGVPLEQSIAADRPLYVGANATFGGKSIIHHRASTSEHMTGDALASALAGTSHAYTLAMRIQLPEFLTKNGVFWSVGDNVDGARIQAATAISPIWREIRVDDAGGTDLQNRGGGDTALHTVVYLYDGSAQTIEIRIDGVRLGSVTFNAVGAQTFNTMTVGGFRGTAGLTENYEMLWRHIGLYGRRLSDAEVLRVENFMGSA